MRAVISTKRIVSIFCLLMTLVISLFIGNYYFAHEDVVEGLTGGNNTDAATEAATEAKTAAKEAKKSAAEAKKSAEEAKKMMGDTKNTDKDTTNMVGDTKNMVGDTKKTTDSSSTGIKEGFELQYAPVSNEAHIRTTRNTQPNMPAEYNKVGVFDHLFSLSNPNERFVIPKV